MSWAKACAWTNLIGLGLTLIGSLLLAYSLSLKSSNYRLVETDNRAVVICLNERVVAIGFGGPLVTTDEPCPREITPSIAPVIEANRPGFVFWGLFFIIMGFLLQLPSALSQALTRGRN
jgi:hypothetical protein